MDILLGTAAVFAAQDPVLAPGEFGYETDTGAFKVGDGSTAWSGLSAFLPLVGGTVSGVLTLQDDLHIYSATPEIWYNETDAATDEKYWRVACIAGDYYIQMWNDALSSAQNAVKIVRNGMTVSQIYLTATTVTVTGDLNPNTSGSWDLGSTSFRWQDVWGATIRTDLCTIVSGTMTYQLNSTEALSIRPSSGAGGWARGVVVVKQSDGLRAGGAGFYGTAETIHGYYVGVANADWWSTYEFKVGSALITCTVPTSSKKTYSSSVSDSSSSGALTIDTNDSNVFKVTMTENVTSFSLSNVSDGQTIRVRFTQDATGSRTISWPASFKWEGSAPVLSTAANAVDLLTATYYSDTAVWLCDLKKGMA